MIHIGALRAKVRENVTDGKIRKNARRERDFEEAGGRTDGNLPVNPSVTRRTRSSLPFVGQMPTVRAACDLWRIMQSKLHPIAIQIASTCFIEHRQSANLTKGPLLLRYLIAIYIRFDLN